MAYKFNFRYLDADGKVEGQLPAEVPFPDATPAGATDEIIEVPNNQSYLSYTFRYDSDNDEWTFTEPAAYSESDADYMTRIRQIVGHKVRELDSKHNSAWESDTYRILTFRWHKDCAALIHQIDTSVAAGNTLTDAQKTIIESCIKELDIEPALWYSAVQYVDEFTKDYNHAQGTSYTIPGTLWATYQDDGDVYSTATHTLSGSPGATGTKIGEITISGNANPSAAEFTVHTATCWTAMFRW